MIEIVIVYNIIKVLKMKLKLIEKKIYNQFPNKIKYIVDFFLDNNSNIIVFPPYYKEVNMKIKLKKNENRYEKQVLYSPLYRIFYRKLLVLYKIITKFQDKN